MRNITKAFRVLRDQYRTMSTLEFAHFVGELLFRHDRILIYVRALPTAGGPEPAHTPRLPIVKGTPADLDAVRGTPSGIPWEFLCDRYDGVKDFFILRHAGGIGHISWVYYASDPNRILRLGPAECEIKFCLTAPELRGKGIYPAALTAIQHYVASRGCQRCFVCVKAENTASVRGIEKAGFRRAGTMHLRKICGVQVARPRATAELEDMQEVLQ